jgi:hypothetical protein
MAPKKTTTKSSKTTKTAKPKFEPIDNDNDTYQCNLCEKKCQSNIDYETINDEDNKNNDVVNLIVRCKSCKVKTVIAFSLQDSDSESESESESASERETEESAGPRSPENEESEDEENSISIPSKEPESPHSEYEDDEDVNSGSESEAD